MIMAELINYNVLKEIPLEQNIIYNSINELKDQLNNGGTSINNFVMNLESKLHNNGLNVDLKDGVSKIVTGAVTSIEQNEDKFNAISKGILSVFPFSTGLATSFLLAGYDIDAESLKKFYTIDNANKFLDVVETLGLVGVPILGTGLFSYALIGDKKHPYVTQNTLQYFLDIAAKYTNFVTFDNYDTPIDSNQVYFNLKYKKFGTGLAYFNYLKSTLYSMAVKSGLDEIVENDVNKFINSYIYYYNNEPTKNLDSLFANCIALTTYYNRPWGLFPADVESQTDFIYSQDIDYSRKCYLNRMKFVNWTNKEDYTGIYCNTLQYPPSSSLVMLIPILESSLIDESNYKALRIRRVKMSTDDSSKVDIFENYKNEETTVLVRHYDNTNLKGYYYEYELSSSSVGDYSRLKSIISFTNLGYQEIDNPFTKSDNKPITTIDEYRDLINNNTVTLKRDGLDEDDIELFPLNIPKIQNDNNKLTIDDLINLDGISKLDENITANNVANAIDILNDMNIINTSIPNKNIGSTPLQTPLGVLTGSGFFNIYNPTVLELKEFNNELWTTNVIEQIKQMFTNPLDSIISLHMLYLTPTKSENKEPIVCGYHTFNTQTYKVTNTIMIADFGTVTINETYGNYLDYEPYTKMTIYLPFIGYQDINTSIFTNAKCKLIYKIDVLTGACIAELRCIKDNTEQLINTFSGNMGVHLPITSGSYLGILSGILSAGVQASTYNFGGALSSLGNMRTSVHSNGSLTANYSALAHKTPYIQITRSNPYVANNYNAYTGIESAINVQLKNLRGYTKVREIHLENINATDDELAMIYNLLKEGVIL